MRQQQDEPGRFSICSRQAAVVLVDPFAGLHKVPIAAERLGRRWLATDKIMEWLAISRNLFTVPAPGYKSNPMLDELAELYRT
ncbi:hypothetical protein NVS48_24360 [Escherichia coli]|nr:hypothetical protein [Escherichia coli]